MSQVLTIVHRVISTFLIKRARMTVKSGAQSGAVTLIQRFGSALNLNPHFHLLYFNGVYDAKGYFWRGSGWVMLGLNKRTNNLENYWLADHAHGPAGTIPLLVMDLYEHSYQMDYGAATAKYIDAFFNNISCDSLAQRLETARA